MIDLHTLFLTSIISRGAFLTVFTLTVMSQPRECYLRHWMVALVCSGLGLLFFLEPVTGPLSTFFGALRQLLILASLAFSWSGLRLFYRRPVRYGDMGMLTLLPTVLYSLLIFLGVPDRFALPTLFLAASWICVLAIREVIASPEKRLIVQYVIALAFLLYFAGLFPPVMLLPLGIISGDILTGGSFTMLLDQVGCVMIYFGYIAMSGENTNLKLRQLAETDPLTGLTNRRGVQRALQKRQAFHSGVAGVVIGDLDRFKPINDSLGHEAGDAVLRCFAQRLSGMLRSEDIAVRWGGEEFLILLPDTGINEAGQFAERLRHSVAETPFMIGRHRLEVTISLGVAESHPHDQSLETAIQRADTALYRAKNGGRNRVCHQHYEPGQHSTPNSEGA
ncbi:GGDEF domain-containing protein [Kushneria aurantia]|uniref:diguanylate cyclase n=1 Tax=Kushneria aurantia TaxID=504092 RepID=A0ABV6G1D6_9GAMM|nr:GGDEF domain-containing protein [Kushneria aurantia]